MKFKLKPLTKKGIPAALKKVERYRLLNEPREAESICLDILDIDPNNQKAAIALLLSLTDQFQAGATAEQAKELLPRIRNKYERLYYEGIVRERMAKATLSRGSPGTAQDAYEWFREAMELFEKAEAIRPRGNDDAILRWNACARAIMVSNLSPRVEERVTTLLE